MNENYNLFVTCICFFFILDCLDESDVVEKLYWTPENKSQNIQWEFSIIGKRVAWDVGRTLCSSSQTSPTGPMNEDSIEDTLLRETPSTTRWNSRNLETGGLAIFNKAAMKPWLARMLSESNYREKITATNSIRKLRDRWLQSGIKIFFSSYFMQKM